MFDPFPYLGSALILNLVLALLLWHKRNARQKPVSYAAIFGPAVFANAAVPIGWIWYREGWLILMPGTWEFGKGGVSADVLLAALSTVFCGLSAWVIAVCLQKHNEKVRFPETIVSAARKLTWHHPLVLWLAVVIPSAGYGLLGPGFNAQAYGPSFSVETATEAALPSTGIGFAVGTCLAVGTLAIQRVRSRASNKVMAILLVMAASCLSAVVPAATMAATGYYHEMAGMLVMVVGEVTRCISIVGLLISATCILCIRRH